MLQVPTAGPSDSVFVTLLRTAVGRASCGVHQLRRFNTGVLAVADCLFGLYGSERTDELFTGSRSPLPPVPNKPYVASVDVKQHNRKDKITGHT